MNKKTKILLGSLAVVLLIGITTDDSVEEVQTVEQWEQEQRQEQANKMTIEEAIANLEALPSEEESDLLEKQVASRKVEEWIVNDAYNPESVNFDETKQNQVMYNGEVICSGVVKMKDKNGNANAFQYISVLKVNGENADIRYLEVGGIVVEQSSRNWEAYFEEANKTIYGVD